MFATKLFCYPELRPELSLLKSRAFVMLSFNQFLIIQEILILLVSLIFSQNILDFTFFILKKLLYF